MARFVSECRWLAVTDGELPPSAYSGGIDECDQPMYVTRTKYAGDVIPGYTVTSSKFCLFTWQGDQQELENFEVLQESFADEFEWEASSNGDIVRGAVRGGVTKGGETIYIGRVKHENGYVIGQIIPSLGACFIPLDGKERRFPHYEVLACCVIDHYDQLLPEQKPVEA